MRPSQTKRTEAERVAAWKAKNRDKVRAQGKRKRLRKAAQKRALDPTGELAYGPIEGVDSLAPSFDDNDNGSQAVKPGIEEPLGFAAALARENKRAALEKLRAEVALVQPKRPT